jgi:hypothetical protein
MLWTIYCVKVWSQKRKRPIFEMSCVCSFLMKTALELGEFSCTLVESIHFSNVQKN